MSNIKDKVIGRDQSLARAINNDLVIKALRENDLSATELAKKLDLSNAAMTSILRNLVNDGLIKACGSISKLGKGRKQVIYTLNEDYGLVVVLSFASYGYNITLSNIKEDILFECEKFATFYDETLILSIINLLKELLSQKRYSNIPLKNITISYPGRINTKENELQQSNVFASTLCGKAPNLMTLIKEHFDCPVFIYNDINLAIMGEIRNGHLQNVNNGMIIYVDNGIGGALLLNGKFYGGDNGYAGEIGLFTSSFKSKIGLLDDFVSLRSIKEYYQKEYGKSCAFLELLNIYKEKGTMYDYINETANSLGIAIKDIVELLNITTIIVSGRVVEFKDKYYENIIKEANSSINHCNIIFDNSLHKSIIVGAISMAYDKAIPNIDKDFVSIN